MRAEDVAARFEGTRRSGSGWVARCPAHEDRQASLSISTGSDGRVLLKCHAGCPTESVVAAAGLTMTDLFPDEPKAKVPKPAGLTVEQLAAAKKLDPSFLASLGVRTERGVVVIPYTDADGNVIAIRRRHALTGARFSWRRGDRPTLYGLDRLRAERGAVLVVEGESDAWALWQAGIAAVGVPGKATWREEFAAHLRGREVFVWQEPDAGDFTARIAADLPDVKVIIAEEYKDPADVHAAGVDLASYIRERMRTARPAAEIVAAEAERRKVERHAAAREVLEHPDPLVLVEEAIRASGYGGDIRPAVLTYLAATTRLLALRPGQMPAHVIVLGPPAAGKSRTIQAALRLLPPDAAVEIDAGSPRVLIYSDDDLRHRVVVFSEADSLPAGEDNPAASAVRALLQEGRLRYRVTVRDPSTGDFSVREIDKPGPTVCITTATRSLGGQLMSRFWPVEVPDDPVQIRAALDAQAGIELEGAGAQPEALVAFQAYLAELAPLDVIVPFARELARELGRRPAANRITRDFSRLLALVKAVALLRIAHRQRDAAGRLIATIADYEAVVPLIAEAFETANAASARIRAVVEAIEALQAERGPETPIRGSDVAERLQWPANTAWRHIQAAMRGGWVVNRETRRSYPADLTLGDQLPEAAGLPEPATIEAQGEIFPSVRRGIVESFGAQPAHGVPPMSRGIVDRAEGAGSTNDSTMPPSTDGNIPLLDIPTESDFPRSAIEPDLDDTARALGVVPDEPYQPDPDPNGEGFIAGYDLPADSAIWDRPDHPTEAEVRPMPENWDNGAYVPLDDAPPPTDPIADEAAVWEGWDRFPEDERRWLG